MASGDAGEFRALRAFVEEHRPRRAARLNRDTHGVGSRNGETKGVGRPRAGIDTKRPVGIEGGTKRIVDFLMLTKPQALIATPSFGEYLIEKSVSLTGKEAKDLGVRWFFCAAEPGGGINAVRKRLAEGFNARVYDHTGGGHAFHGICCGDEEYRGMHFISPDHCILELIDPETKKPVDMVDGAIGEMVFTFLDWEGGPFLRYVLGDVLQIFTKPCVCGFPGIRFNILGRGDDMLIVKGVNLYPSAIKEAVARFHPKTTGVLKILLDKPGPLVKPPLKLQVEYGSAIRPQDTETLKEEIRKHMKDNLRVNPEIELVPPGSGWTLTGWRDAAPTGGRNPSGRAS